MPETIFTGRTLDILKNFQTINPSMAFRPGKTLATVAISRKILAIADIEQPVDAEFGIFELGKFFNAMSLFKQPTVKLEKQFINISENKRSLNYITCDTRDIIAPPVDVNREMPSVDVQFGLTEKMIKDALKAAGILNQPHLVFEGNGENVFLTTQNVAKPTNESYREDVGDFDGGENKFKIVLKTENIKVLPGDYLVRISFAGPKVVQFLGKDIMYFFVSEEKLSQA